MAELLQACAIEEKMVEDNVKIISYWSEPEVRSAASVVVGTGLNKRVIKIESLLSIKVFLKRWLKKCKIGSRQGMTNEARRRRYICRQTQLKSSILAKSLDKWNIYRIKKKHSMNIEYTKRLVESFRSCILKKYGLKAFINYMMSDLPLIYNKNNKIYQKINKSLNIYNKKQVLHTMKYNKIQCKSYRNHCHIMFNKLIKYIKLIKL